MLRKLTLYAIVLPLFSSIALLTSCDDDITPPPQNEPEVITKATLSFNDGTNTIVATYLDADGDGPGNPVFTPATIELVKNTTYNLTIAFSNTLTDPEEDITAEVEEEGEEHQIFYSFTGGVFTNSSTNYSDTDDNGNPIGIKSSWTTGATANTTGNLTVTLKHQPDIKSATTTVSDGETDFAQDFAIKLID